MTESIYQAALAWRSADLAFNEADRAYCEGAYGSEMGERAAWRRVDDAQEALNAARRDLASLCDRALSAL